MSYCPGYTLEEWLAYEYSLNVYSDGQLTSDSWRAKYAGQRVVTHEQFYELLDMFRPHREYVEEKLLDFNEEEQSWRSYNSAVFGSYFDDKDFNNRADALVKSWNAQVTKSVFEE